MRRSPRSLVPPTCTASTNHHGYRCPTFLRSENGGLGLLGFGVGVGIGVCTEYRQPYITTSSHNLGALSTYKDVMMDKTRPSQFYVCAKEPKRSERTQHASMKQCHTRIRWAYSLFAASEMAMGSANIPGGQRAQKKWTDVEPE